MNRLEDVINVKKLQELLGKKEEEKRKDSSDVSPFCWIMATVLIAAAVAAIAYVAYRYFTPDCLEDFEDDLEDDFDDEFFDEEEDIDASPQRSKEKDDGEADDRKTEAAEG